MPWQPDHKQQSRHRILDAAATLFTTQGFDRVGINDVMQAAGMTRGAFYNHFSSKSELYSAAIRHSGGRRRQMLNATRPNLQQMVHGYLSKAHRAGEAIQCPLAYLVTDVAQRDEQVRDAWSDTFKGFVRQLQSDRSPDAPLQPEALQRAATLIGAMAISRTLSDSELSDQLLESCIEGLCPSSQRAADN